MSSTRVCRGFSAVPGLGEPHILTRWSLVTASPSAEVRIHSERPRDQENQPPSFL